MHNEINMYCDESCHLENDRNKIMVIGAVWLDKAKRKEICKRIRSIKEANGIKQDYELKWSKISKCKKRAYMELINMFFDDDDLHFRCVIVKNKNALNFDNYQGDYDDWYYKIYFLMINQILSSSNYYNVYLDIKDTNSSVKLKTLKKVIEFATKRTPINNMQVIRSEEVEIMQLTDILIGAMSYFSRNLHNSKTKLEIINLIKERSNNDLIHNSLLRDDKFNIFYWEAKE